MTKSKVAFQWKGKHDQAFQTVKEVVVAVPFLSPGHKIHLFLVVKLLKSVLVQNCLRYRMGKVVISYANNSVVKEQKKWLPAIKNYKLQ